MLKVEVEWPRAPRARSRAIMELSRVPCLGEFLVIGPEGDEVWQVETVFHYTEVNARGTVAQVRVQ